MIKAYILVVMLNAYNGGSLSFQEFNDSEHCNEAKELIILKNKENSVAIKYIFCTEK